MEACLHCTAPLARWERWLVPVGVWSYSFYLWHHPLIGRILHYLDRLGLPQTSVVLFVVVPTLVLGLILLWSWAAYSLVEKPCLRAGHALLVRWRSSGPTTGK